MRIVGGRLRGRPLEVPSGDAVRPTSDRAREALFNILEHGRFARSGSPFAGKPVLDAFAGTGAFGLEALSRGASRAIFIDRRTDTVRRNVASVQEQGSSRVITGDVSAPPPAEEAVAVAFLDPPYREGLAAPSLTALRRKGWLDARSLAIVELGAREPFEPPTGFQLEDERRYGAARLLFLKVTEGNGAASD